MRLLLLLTPACAAPGVDVDLPDWGDTSLDADGDGSAAPADCDDGDINTHPGAMEVCDGVDNDCDGSEDGVVTFTAADGSISDLSASFRAGTPAAPTWYAPRADGALSICPGTYYVSLVIDDRVLSIEGLDGEALTTLDGGGGPLLTGTGAELELDDLTLRGGVAERGGAISLRSSALEVDHVTFSGNTAALGGAIYLLDSAADLDEVSLADNSAELGGAIHLDASALVMDDTALADNSADRGGAVYMERSTAAIEDSSFSANRAADGGALYLTDSALILEDSAIADNAADGLGGGIALGDTASELAVSGGLLSGNTASEGGGLYLAEGSVSLSGVELTGGDADTGGGISVSGGALTLRDSAVTDNRAAEGAGLLLRAGWVSADRSDWSGQGGDDLLHVPQAQRYTWGEDASFTCDEAGCVTE